MDKVNLQGAHIDDRWELKSDKTKESKVFYLKESHGKNAFAFHR